MLVKWIFPALVLASLSGCKNQANDPPDGPEEKVAEVANPEVAQDLAKPPHEAVNGLLLTAEVLDQEKWIVGLTWENIGDAPLMLPMAGYLKDDISKGYANPFYRPAYSNFEISLSNGKHSNLRVFDFSRDGIWHKEDAYRLLRETWGLGGSLHDSKSHEQYDEFMRLRSGEKVTCFFRYPRFKTDEESGFWKEGDKIPIDFRYVVSEQVAGSNRISLSSGQLGQAIEHRQSPLWHGKVHSNVVYLEWIADGERVRWPADPYTEQRPEPVNDLLLSLEIEDEKEWIVRLTWKNVGTSPIEVPIRETLWYDIKKSNEWKSSPVMCTPGHYTNYRHHGRPFGSELWWGEQADERLFDFNRDGKHGSDHEAYEDLLRLRDEFSTGNNRAIAMRGGIKWFHLKPGGTKSIRFWFPQFESDDKDTLFGWKERDKIPLEFCFKAGEIPYENSLPPEREERISDDEIRFTRYPAWQGKVYSNVVFFTWTKDGPRVNWSGDKN